VWEIDDGYHAHAGIDGLWGSVDECYTLFDHASNSAFEIWKEIMNERDYMEIYTILVDCSFLSLTLTHAQQYPSRHSAYKQRTIANNQHRNTISCYHYHLTQLDRTVLPQSHRYSFTSKPRTSSFSTTQVLIPTSTQPSQRRKKKCSQPPPATIKTTPGTTATSTKPCSPTPRPFPISPL